MDAITLKRIDTAHPILRTELRAIYDEICIRLKGRAICRFAYVYRSEKEQNDLYALGRTKKGKKVTWVKGGYSYHQHGLAVDIVLIKDTNKDGGFDTASWETNVDFDGDGMADWLEVRQVFEKFGWESGSRWKTNPDWPHFQKTFGYKASELKDMAKVEGVYPKIDGVKKV